MAGLLPESTTLWLGLTILLSTGFIFGLVFSHLTLILTEMLLQGM